MPATLPAPTAARHRLLPDMRPAMAKADLRKADLVAVNRRYCRRDIDLLFHSPAREAAVHVLTRRVG